MLLNSFWSGFLVLYPVTRAIGGQVPVVDGVIGGVRNTKTSASFVDLMPQVASTSATITPGKLRVVENSGICGELAVAPEDILVYQVHCP
jgi:hypothetical protein